VRIVGKPGPAVSQERLDRVGYVLRLRPGFRSPDRYALTVLRSTSKCRAIAEIDQRAFLPFERGWALTIGSDGNIKEVAPGSRRPVLRRRDRGSAAPTWQSRVNGRVRHSGAVVVVW
jgi:hypothetical protein